MDQNSYQWQRKQFKNNKVWLAVDDRGDFPVGAQAAGVLATVKRDAIERAGGTWSPEDEAEFKRPTQAFIDQLISFKKDLSALGMADYCSSTAGILDHGWRDLPGKGTPLLPADVLAADNNPTFIILDGRCKYFSS